MESSYENVDFRKKFVNYIKEYTETEPVIPKRHFEQINFDNHKENKNEETQPFLK
jgi:hypothetical protein